MDENAVTSEAEGTVSSTSQVEQGQSMAQTANEEMDTSVDTSSEDINTRTEETEAQDLVSEAQNEVKSERGQGRVQQLANTLSQRDRELAEAQQKITEYEKAIQGGAIPRDDQRYVLARQDILEAKAQLQQEKLDYAEAKAEYPWLNPKSSDYDEGRANLVAKLRKSGMSYEEAASELESTFSSVKKVAQEKAVEQVANKVFATQAPVKKSQTNAEDNDLDKATKAFLESGDESAFDKLLEAGVF